MIEIVHRYTKAVLYKSEDAKTICEAVVEARRSGTYLRDAYLEGAYLRGVNLRDAYLRDAYLRNADLKGVNLRGADLRDAYLEGADLRNADLRDAHLGGAYLEGADLKSVNLRGADLRGAYFRGTDLGGADLRGADLNWQSHHLISEILWQAADTEPREMLAAFVGRKTEWCRDDWKQWNHPERDWAICELRKWVKDGDGSPAWLTAQEDTDG